MRNKTLDHVFSSILAITDDNTPVSEVTERKRFLKINAEKYFNNEGEGEVASVSKTDVIPPHLRERFAEIEADAVAEAARRYDVLFAEHTALEARYSALMASSAIVVPEEAPVVSGGNISFASFRDLVVAKLGMVRGRERGWQLAFQVGSGNAYDWGDITKWGKSDEVPVEAVAALDTFDLVAAQATINKPQVTWTDAQRDAVRSFLRNVNGKLKYIEGHTGASVAVELSKMFGIDITEGAVKSQKSRIEKEAASNKVVNPNFGQKAKAEAVAHA